MPGEPNKKCPRHASMLRTRTSSETSEGMFSIASQSFSYARFRKFALLIAKGKAVILLMERLLLLHSCTQGTGLSRPQMEV